MKSTERERAAFLLGVEWAAEHLPTLRLQAKEDDLPRGKRRGDKELLFAHVLTLAVRMDVSKRAMAEADMDLKAPETNLTRPW